MNSIDTYLNRSLRAVIFIAAARGAARSAPCLALFWPVAWLDAVAPQVPSLEARQGAPGQRQPAEMQHPACIKR